MEATVRLSLNATYGIKRHVALIRTRVQVGVVGASDRNQAVISATA